MLTDLRADSATWQAERERRKSDKAAAATEDVYPGKQPDMSYQKYRFQFSYPNDSPAWTGRDYSVTYGQNKESKTPSLHSDLVSSDSASRNASANQESQRGTGSSHACKPPNELHMNRAPEDGTCPSGQTTITREVIPKHDYLLGHGSATDLTRESISPADKTSKPRDAPPYSSECARN
jgi:hypothetical protein